MKGVSKKYLGLLLISTIALALSSQSAFAQRPGNGGGSRGGAGMSRGGGGQISGSRPFAGNRQPGMMGPSRNRPNGGYRPGVGVSPRINQPNRFYNRPYVYNNRGGYRSGYFGNNRRYFGYYNFYRPYIGFRLNVLPFGYYPFYYGNSQFYYSDGLFYQQNNQDYQVVVPPVGAEVPNLPENATLINIDGVDYYEFKGVYYTLGTNADGKSVYIVAGKDGVLKTADGEIDTHEIGDVVNDLPSGSKEIYIKNEKYFVSPDQVYYEAVMQGDTITGYRLIGKLN